MIKNNLNKYGFIKPEIEEGNYYFGGGFIPEKKIINESGQWIDYLPTKEIQVFSGKDTWACSVFGTLNAIETLLKFKIKNEFNYSDRFLAIKAEVKLGIGGDPHKVAETLRTQGVCREELLPISDVKTIEEFYQPNPLPETLKVEAEKFNYQFDLKHEYVFKENDDLATKQAKIIENLKYSPLGISVSAWYKNGDKFYKPTGVNDNHWICLIGYKLNDYWIIYDSSEDDIKYLEWNYNFEVGKVYHLFPISPEEAERRRKEMLGLLGKWLNLLMEWAKRLLTTNTKTEQTPQIAPVLPQETPIHDNPIETQQAEKEIFDNQWGIPEKARHSCRVIMDEYGLSWKEKDLLCDICQCESGFNPNAKLVNSPQSIDRGLFQWNSFYHPDITDEMAFNPEIATRLACKALKNKKIKILWSASMKCWNKNGKYNDLLI